METRIDPTEHWITDDEAPTLVSACTHELAEMDQMGYGEEFDLFAATMSEAPPPPKSFSDA